MTFLGHRSASTDTERRYRRINRRTYVVEILLIFALSLIAQIAFARFSITEVWVDVTLTALLLFLIGRAFAGRFHDIGRNDNWTMIPLVIFSGGWLVVAFWHEAPMWAEVLARLAWVLALFTPLLFRGDEGENQFGSAPEKAVELKVIANVG